MLVPTPQTVPVPFANSGSVQKSKARHRFRKPDLAPGLRVYEEKGKSPWPEEQGALRLLTLKVR